MGRITTSWWGERGKRRGRGGRAKKANVLGGGGVDSGGGMR